MYVNLDPWRVHILHSQGSAKGPGQLPMGIGGAGKDLGPRTVGSIEVNFVLFHGQTSSLPLSSL